jgi:multimeric flavodoxin WrbA
LLEEALQGIREADPEAKILVLRVLFLNINPCLACGECHEDGTCAHNDDMQVMYERLDEADIVIVAAPVFFMGLPAPMKVLVDRCQCIWIRNFILKTGGGKDKKRIGAFLSTAGQPEEKMFVGADHTIGAWFATLGLEYKEKLFVNDMDRFSAVKKQPEVLEKARALGKRLVEALQK